MSGWVHLSALIFLVYGIIVFLTGSGSLFFLFWIGLSLIIEGAFFLYRKGFWNKLPAYARKTVTLATVFVLCLFVYTEIRIISDFNAEPEETVDYLIVLGAMVYEDGPSEICAQRLDKAAEYLKKHPETRCIVSGGQGFQEPCPEAEQMYKYLLAQNIEESRIIKESAAKNTFENIRNSFTLLDRKNDRIGIVTNQFHMHRSLLIARKAGAQNVYGLSADSDAFFLPNNMVREFIALVKEFAIGAI